MKAPIVKPGQVIRVPYVDATRAINGKTILVKTSELEVVHLFVPAGQGVPTYEAQGQLVLQCLQGRVSLVALGMQHDLNASELLYLAIDEPFTIQGLEDASLLITIVAAKHDSAMELVGD